MNIRKIFGEDGSMISEAATAREIRSARAILHAVEFLRDEKRIENETKPKESPEDLTRDFRYIAGMIAAYNSILSLPEEAGRYIKSLPEIQNPQ